MPFYTPPAAASQFNDFGFNHKLYAGRGTRTFTVPAGVSTIFVALFGAGGGGGTSTNTTSARVSTGGGGGGFVGAQLAVSAGETFTVALGAGGANSSDGESSEFTNASDVTLLTANGGKKGTAVSGMSDGDITSGGAGGTTSVAASVTNYIANNGGRGGNFYRGNDVPQSGYYSACGGGASGSLVGPGGNGGDIAISGTIQASLCTGGGGWGGSRGGNAFKDDTGTGAHIATGGGGFLNNGGDAGPQDGPWYSGGGCPFYAGRAHGSISSVSGISNNNHSTSLTNNVFDALSANRDYMSWWSILSGPGLLNAHSQMVVRGNPPGCGAAASYRDSGIGGGEGGVNGNNGSAIPSINANSKMGSAVRFGGGGGGGYYYTNDFISIYDDLPSKTDTGDKLDVFNPFISYISAPLGGGAGGKNNTTSSNLGMRGGDGWCVIVW